MNGSSSDNSPKWDSGCSALLMLSISDEYSTSVRRLLTLAGIGPTAIEKRDWPFVRRGSTHRVEVDAGNEAFAALPEFPMSSRY
eukprot:921295-Prymnesium_polylepis.2